MEVAKYMGKFVSRNHRAPCEGALRDFLDTRLDRNQGKHKAVWDETTGEIREAVGFSPKWKRSRKVPKKVIRTYTIGADPKAGEIRIINLLRDAGPKEIVQIGTDGIARSQIVTCEGKKYEERTDARNLSPREERVLLRQFRRSNIHRVFIGR